VKDNSMFTDAEFAQIAREIKTRTGYALTLEHASTIETRLMALQRRENLSSVNELIAATRMDGRLWNAIAEALAVQETRFFRDRALFHALRTDILPALMHARGKPLNVWSAGCSTGQEAYSLALTLDALRNEGKGSGEIIATDFAERHLEKARSGLYTQFEVQRGLPIRTLITHFEKVSDLWRISDRLRAQVRFEQHNLLDDAARLGAFDLVLCCNVLNGLDPAARSRVLENIAGALAPDGVLVTGAEGVISAAGEAYSTFGSHVGVYRRNAHWRRAA